MKLSPSKLFFGLIIKHNVSWVCHLFMSVHLFEMHFYKFTRVFSLIQYTLWIDTSRSRSYCFITLGPAYIQDVAKERFFRKRLSRDQHSGFPAPPTHTGRHTEDAFEHEQKVIGRVKCLFFVPLLSRVLSYWGNIRIMENNHLTIKIVNIVPKFTSWKLI